jgi:hypothetical protein
MIVKLFLDRINEYLEATSEVKGKTELGQRRLYLWSEARQATDHLREFLTFLGLTDEEIAILAPLLPDKPPGEISND